MKLMASALVMLAVVTMTAGAEVTSYPSSVKPDAPELRAAIEQALK